MAVNGLELESSIHGPTIMGLRESWIRGSLDSQTISFGQTDGLSRFKIEDFVPCMDGTLLGVEGKLGDSDM